METSSLMALRAILARARRALLQPGLCFRFAVRDLARRQEQGRHMKKEGGIAATL
jgi:hypothetical protein